jgi:hypothetical protein
MHELKQLLDELSTIDEFWVTVGPEPYIVNIILKFEEIITPANRLLVTNALLQTLEANRAVNTLFYVEDYDMIVDTLFA